MMRLLFFLPFVLITFAAHAETPEQFFDQANLAYQQGKFIEAIRHYEQILQGGEVSGELYYNLGNAYYKAGDLGKAILNYERALKLLSTDDDVRHNLQLANLMITDKIDPTPRRFFWEWWDVVKQTFSLNGITWLCYGLFLLIIGSSMLAILAPSYALRRMAFVGGVASTVLFIGGMLVFVGKLNNVQSLDSAIVTTNITTVKNSPDTKSSDAFVIHSGVKVVVTDKVENWIKIRLADGKVGWMEQKAAETI